jgi:hypothetical protein
MREFQIVPYDAGKHLAWVTDSFRRSLQDQWPWAAVPPFFLLEDLRRQMATGRTVVAVAEDDADAYLGWCAAHPEANEIVFAFTKFHFRQRFGVGVALATAAGVDLTRPTGVRYWTRASERIDRKPGYRLYHRVTDDVAGMEKP